MLYLNNSSGIINTQTVRRQSMLGRRRATNTFCQLSEHGRQVLDRKMEGGGGGEEQGKQT